MKTSFVAITLMALLLFGGPRDARAQIYGGYPYISYEDIQYQYYLQWQQYLNYLQQNDPYYQLHMVHYRLYLGPYQPYQIYQPCCDTVGVPITVWSTPMSPQFDAFGRLPTLYRW
jgi:hypothetical protein